MENQEKKNGKIVRRGYKNIWIFSSPSFAECSYQTRSQNYSFLYVEKSKISSEKSFRPLGFVKDSPKISKNRPEMATEITERSRKVDPT